MVEDWVQDRRIDDVGWMLQHMAYERIEITLHKHQKKVAKKTIKK